jgi:filamentous hemagglutinin family protein
MRAWCCHSICRRLIAVGLALGVALDTTANPTGMTVQNGSATSTTSGSQLTVTTSPLAVLNWQSFNIGSGESTIFNQPSIYSVVVNNIHDANASQIYGSLQANGLVVLMNQNGFYFGPDSFVKTGGLIVSTANCLPPQNAGGAWEFNGPPPLASIVNYGQIQVGQNSSLYLIADKIENHGSLTAPGGTIGLAAGQTVLLSDRPDGRGLSMQVTLPSGSVDNEGRLIADGGTIALNAKVVNQNGFIQANSVKNVNGTIELVASDQLTLGANSQISADGDDLAGGSAGGNVTLESGNSFNDDVGSRIEVTGGSRGGNGGNVEISASSVQSLNSSIDARAQAGWTAGKLLLDPDYIILDTSGSGNAGSGTVLAGSNPGSTLDLNVNTAFANLAVSQIILQALYDITIAGGTSWNLSQTIGANFGGVTSGQLTLEAGRNIIFGDNSQISDANKWSVALAAGYNFINNAVQTGVGSIYLNGGSGQTGSGSIQTASGSIKLNAGDGIQIGSGTVSSSAGNIAWQAGGDIQFGAGSQIIGGNDESVELSAGYNFINNAVQTGVGSIYLNSGSGSIQLSQGAIELTAGDSIAVGSGSQLVNNGGTIGLSAQMVEQDGLMQANSTANHGGVIQLAASGTLDFGANSQTVANGGEISASGTTVNQSGLVQADTVQGQSGVVKLTAADTLNLDANSKTVASGGGVILQAVNNLNLAVNSQVVADSGTVFGSATEVNQNGLIQANSVGNQHGVIELVASDVLTLGVNSQILAQGDDTPSGSAGGNVTLQAYNKFSDSSSSQIITEGGANGGNGGNVEINAPTINAATTKVYSTINTSAQPGWQSGQVLLFYLANLILGSTDGALPDGNGTINETSSTGTSYVNVNSAFQNITSGQILLEASGNISLDANTVWDLTASTGNRTSGKLTLDAGGDIIFGDGSKITDANNWSVLLQAGYSWANNAVQAGIGNIYLNGGSGQNGSGSIQLSQGAINLTAGNNISVGSGYVITTGGGSIYASALEGNIDTGTDAQGYFFNSKASSLSQAYNLSGGGSGIILGGISTAAGGDVTLIAGGDVTSYLPGSSDTGDALTAGAGAYGPQPGNVTIVAGGNVSGNYVVANGYGSIYAGAQMDANGNPIVKTDAHNQPITEKDANGNTVKDASGNPIYVYALDPTSGGNAGTDPLNPNLALDLISGGWNVAAANNIYLQQVCNPNGAFNGSGAYSHYFNYAANAYVNLSAGNQVQLGASTSVLPHLSRVSALPFIYAPILNIAAGAGGVVLGTGTSPNSLTLFPSAQGSLTIDTTAGGGLSSGLNPYNGGPQQFNLIVSDANHNNYTTTLNFGVTDHASSPIHSDNPTPIDLNISGDMNLICLIVPEAAQIGVGGNMVNCSFQGMNLSAAPSFPVQIQEADGSTRTVTVDPGVTSINVAGEIYNRGNYTSIDLGQMTAPDLSVLSQALNLPGEPSASALASSFYYNSTTHTLTYQNIPGFTLLQVLTLLSNLPLQQYVNGVPQWEDPPNDTIPTPDPNGPVSVLGNPNPNQAGTTIASLLLQQFNSLGAPSQNAMPHAPNGYYIGGGGQFNITGQTIDLGTSGGIQSLGAALYNNRGSYPLAGLFGNGGVFNHGADINLTTTGNHSEGVNQITGEPYGDLDMFSSSIASLNGGGISINAGGDINAGSSVLAVNTSSVRGIYTTGGGDVSVIADGNVNVNGSRIVTYDGGDLTVESLDGDVNAGSGASSLVSVTGYYEDPSTHTVYSDSPQLPFSGIVAMTFPKRPDYYPAPDAVIGNILVEAPHGTINANTAGILQIPLNGVNYPDAVTTVLAGYQLNNSGQPVVVLDNQNIVTFGSTSQLTLASGTVSLTQLLDAGGTPVLDANGNQIYVENLGKKGGPLVTIGVIDGNTVLNPYVDVGKEPISAVNPSGAIDVQGNPIFVMGRNIDVNGSGLIASNAKLGASGNVYGLVFARNNIDIAGYNIDVTALGGGDVSVNSNGGNVSGTFIGVGGVSVSGDSINDADMISINVSGDTSGQNGLGNGTAADAASQGMTAENSATPAGNDETTSSDNDEKKKKGKAALVQKAGRVTVILPPRQQSKAQTQEPRT